MSLNTKLQLGLEYEKYVQKSLKINILIVGYGMKFLNTY